MNASHISDFIAKCAARAHSSFIGSPDKPTWKRIAETLAHDTRRLHPVTRATVLYVIEQAGINCVDSTRELARDIEQGTRRGSLEQALVHCFIGGAGTLAVDSRDAVVVRWFARRGIRG